MADVNLSIGVNATEVKAGLASVEAQVEATKKRLASAGPVGGTPYDAVAAGGVRAGSSTGQLKPLAPGMIPPPGAAHPMWGRLSPEDGSQLSLPKAGGLTLAQIGGIGASATLLVGSMIKVTEAINRSRTEMAQLQQAAANYWSGQAEAVATGGGAQMLSFIGTASNKLRDLHQELQILGMKSKLGQFSNFMLELVGGEGDTGKRQNIAMQQFMGQSQMLVALDRYNDLAAQAATIERMRADGLGDQADQLELATRRGQERLALETAIQKAGASKGEREQLLGDFDKRTDDSIRMMREAQAKKKADTAEKEAIQAMERDAKIDAEWREMDEKDAKKREAQREKEGKELDNNMAMLGKTFHKLEKEKEGPGRSSAPSIIASSRAELGLGGGTFAFGGSDPTEKLVRALERNTEVHERLAPAVARKNFNHKP